MFRSFSFLLPAACSAWLVGCATTPPQPLPFELVGKGNAQYQGQFNPADRSIDVTIGKKLYTGFYVTSVTTSRSTDMGYPGFRPYGYGMGGWPRDIWTTTSNNTGKAYLKAADGDSLTCDFMFEGARLLGECQSVQGDTKYQMVADPTPAN